MPVLVQALRDGFYRLRANTADAPGRMSPAAQQTGGYFVMSDPFVLFGSVISSSSQPETIARAVTSGGYGGNVVSRVSSTGPPTVKW